RRFGNGAAGTGVMEIIKGNIGAIGGFTAIGAFTVIVVFSSQGRGSKEGARSSLLWENDLPFCSQAVHLAALAEYIGVCKFPCNLNDMRSSHGTSDWRCRP